MLGTVALLRRYPVKSMLGEDVPVSDVTGRGLDHDRVLALLRYAMPTLEHGCLPRDTAAVRVVAEHNRIRPLETLGPQPCAGAYAQVLRRGGSASGTWPTWHDPAARWQTAGMEKFSLDAIAREQGRRAADAPGGRSAQTVYGGHEHTLRQTVVALTAGSSMSEHENPGEATVQVLRGRVRLVAGDVSWEGRSGDLLIVPGARHALEAVEDSAVLLTVSKA